MLTLVCPNVLHANKFAICRPNRIHILHILDIVELLSPVCVDCRKHPYDQMTIWLYKTQAKQLNADRIWFLTINQSTSLKPKSAHREIVFSFSTKVPPDSCVDETNFWRFTQREFEYTQSATHWIGNFNRRRSDNCTRSVDPYTVKLRLTWQSTGWKA